MNTELYKTNNTHLIDDARKIIETARANAVRSVDFCRVQMYWNLGRRIFEEDSTAKSVPTMERTLSKLLPTGWKQSMVADFQNVSWNFVDNFTVFIQLRTQCVRN